MKKKKCFRITVLFFMISILTLTGCSSQQNQEKLAYNFNETDGSVLNFYRQYSEFTDPGEYEYLYENLPDSLPELCSLIKSQYLNYGWELDMYRDQIPKERWNESLKYPTVKSALKGLIFYDSRGLVKDREPEDRLMLICRDNATLLASILKYRGIPVRVRYGNAPYLIPGFHAGHVICEVWNEDEKRWMLVDPSLDMIDFSYDNFEFSNEVWLKLQKKEIDPKLYGVPGIATGLLPIAAKLCNDMASILGTEYTSYQYPPMVDYAFEHDNHLSTEHIETLNTISGLMKSIDADNLTRLQEIYNNTPQIQMTKTFDPKEIKSENKTSSKDTAINKPIIEFVDISGGTFIMGSPEEEEGRVDDEIQYEVTLSGFKMSKYCITYEQYDLFCEATDRKKTLGI